MGAFLAFYGSTVIACVGQLLTHAMHAMQSAARVGSDFLLTMS
jgi:hypothetical protein